AAHAGDDPAVAVAVAVETYTHIGDRARTVIVVREIAVDRSVRRRHAHALRKPRRAESLPRGEVPIGEKAHTVDAPVECGQVERLSDRAVRRELSHRRHVAIEERADESWHDPLGIAR